MWGIVKWHYLSNQSNLRMWFFAPESFGQKSLNYSSGHCRGFWQHLYSWAVPCCFCIWWTMAVRVWMGLLLFGEGSCATMSQTEMKQWTRGRGWQDDVLRHSTGLRSVRTEQQRHKCQRAKNTNATRSVAGGNSSVWLVNLGRAACVCERDPPSCAFSGLLVPRLHMSWWSETCTTRADCSPLLSLIQSIGKT